MSQITKEITIDVARHRLFQPIIAKQNDKNSRFLKITICNDGKKIDVPDTATVILNAERDDDLSAGFMGTVNSDGTVTVPLTSWMLAVAGTTRCSISIVDNDEQKLTSMSFEIYVEESEYTGEEIKKDENYDILIHLISEAKEATAAALEAAERVDGIVITDSDGTRYLGKLRISDGHPVLDITELE